MKKAVQRMCTVCGEKKDKRELLRIVKNKDQNVYVDKTGKLAGRGAYICYNEDCLKKAIKTKRLEKVLEIKLDNEIYENMRGVIIDRKN